MNCRHHRPLVLLFLLTLLILPSLALAGIGDDHLNVEPKVDLLFESFEPAAFPPVGWYKIHLGDTYTWSRTSAASETGTYSGYIRNGYSGHPQDEYLVTSALDFSLHSSPKISWYEEEINWTTRGGTHYIMVSTTSQTDPSAFEVVAEMTPDNHMVAGFGSSIVEVDLSAYAGEASVYVAFRYVGEYGDYWFIDDVKVFELIGAGGDVTPSMVSPDGVSFNDGEVFTPTADIYNNGTDDAELDVTIQILESGTEVYSESYHIPNLPSDETMTVNFPDFTVTEGHLIQLICTTYMDGDQIPANDSRSVYNTAYSQQHVPMGLLFTQTDCSACPPTNQALDAYLLGQGNDVALSRLHVWWPGSDPMYDDNPLQVQDFVEFYQISGAPGMILDGDEIPYEILVETVVPKYNQAKLIKSPLSIELAFNDDTDELTVTVDIVEMMRPIENFKLFAHLTEDNIYHAGTNGETIHNQVMRHIWPDTDGLDCPTTMGTHTFVIDAPLDGDWVYEELRATVYVQDVDSHIILQAGTDFLTAIDDGVSAVGDQVASAYRLSANYPNPFNPSTTIKFNLPRDEQVEVAVYSVDGAKVATLVSEVMSEGDHQVVWMGKDSSGNSVASGAYFYRLSTASHSETRVMTLIK